MACYEIPEQLSISTDNKTHDVSVGDTVCFGEQRYVILDCDEAFVHLAESDCPLLTTTMSIDEFQRKIMETKKSTECQTDLSGDLTEADTIPAIGVFWDIFRMVKKEEPNKLVMIKLNTGYFAFDQDAEIISDILHLKLSERELSERSKLIKVCFLPGETFSEQFEILGDTGLGLVLADWEPGEGISKFIVNASKRKGDQLWKVNREMKKF